MKRTEKIRLIKGFLSGVLSAKNLTQEEVEVWLQEPGKMTYMHYKTGEVVPKNIVEGRKNENFNIILLSYVEGKTIL
jgi:hypothetical protein